MLVLSRKMGESIMIGDQIEVKVVSVDGDAIRLGISAPREISVHRKEIYIGIKEENELASQSKVDWETMKKWIEEKS
ncbi:MULTISPECIES: carbon storage regulator CsrA [Brevibacillus]|uniref:carbon storage regulator CsrA n=1 Tax=Brevibacillus TaxID=55080 RepID=UPI000D1010A8|nr:MULTISPECIES: carbon storage regulator CsrA [Brevibacillus]NRR23249.1 carbon storage regulator CsrA [Brevibacillus sp. MS2.2]PSJ67301.1 carbon storage regulator [Brevibacillus brevis]RED21643.1 carbon storage regulator CsrA [Brevibacillus brevis]TQK63081.1 carbon storage regulator CsrA [Brevibacillus sp. AG162]VEF86685.1 Carbon storage regulator homolog [Brevibacillus brevis]